MTGDKEHPKGILGRWSRAEQEVILFKVNKLLLPVLFLSVGFTVTYSSVNWILKTKLILVDELTSDLWIPMGLAVILELILIRSPLRVLKLNEQRNIRSLYHFIAIAIVAVPAMLAQRYVQAAAGKMTHVNEAAAIASSPATRFYSADAICLANDKAIFLSDAEVVGKHSETLLFSIYVLIPVCSADGNTQANPSVWIGQKFLKSVSSSIPESKKETEFAQFETRSRGVVFAGQRPRYSFLQREGKNSDLRNFEKLLRQANIIAKPIILTPHTEPFEQRTGDDLAEIFYSFGAGGVIWFGMILYAPVYCNRRRELRTTSPKSVRRGAQISAASFLFLPNRIHYGLPILVDLNIAVFLAMALSGLGIVNFQADDLVAWGANYGPAIHGVGMVRLITSQFIHGGLMHLANNLYGLFFACIALMPAVMNWRLILCYVLSGLGGSIASFIVHPAIVSVGASGAILGLWGIALVRALLGDAKEIGLRKFILINGAAFAGLTLLVGAFSPGIDNAAHIGGFVTGLFLGLVIFLFGRGGRPRLSGRNQRRRARTDDCYSATVCPEPPNSAGKSLNLGSPSRIGSTVSA